MKHYMDITRIKEDDENELTTVNTKAFIGNQYFGKAVNTIAMNYAKDIVLG